MVSDPDDPAAAGEGRPQGARRVPRLRKLVCRVCGFIYDPAGGDPDNGIPANTPFEILPDDWVCPICGVEKAEFTAER